MRAFIYVRVSTQEQAKEGYSIDEQIERLNAFCKAHGWTVAKLYTDAGYSGGNTERPALKELVRDIKKNMADIVLVYKLDRLSRSQKDTLALIDDFLACNVDFVSMTENFDTSSPFGRATIGMLSVFAQLEREQIKERMSMGKEGRAKDGKWHGGGHCPVGYDYVDGKLVINEFEAMQVREIHRLYQEGKGFHTICEIFAKKGYTEKYGEWQPKRVKRCMLSPIYIGKMIHCGTLYDGIHEPIIDEETYNKSLEIYGTKPIRTKPNRSSYLGGLLYCAHCGAKYGVTQTRDTRYDKRFHYYCCYSRRKTSKAMIVDPNCKNKNWRRDDLDEIIFEKIRELKSNPKYFKEIRNSRNPQNDNEMILKEIDKIDAQKSRFMDLYGLGNYSLDELQEKVNQLIEKRAKLEAQLQDIPELSEHDALTLINSFDTILESGVFEEIKRILDSLIEKIIIDDEEITVFWRFS